MSTWKLSWRLACYRPWLFAVSVGFWVAFYTLPLTFGLIARAFFDRLSGEGEVHVGSGRLRRVSDLVAALGAEWLRSEPAANAGPHHHQPADTTRLAELGWSATHTEELFSRD